MLTDPRISNDGTAVDPEGQITPPEEKVEENKFEHDRLEHSDPELYTALTAEGAYLYHKDAGGYLLIRSTKEDKSNPRNWANWKRYLTVTFASYLNVMVRCSA